uniref:Nudix hydrolase domain-containing protein n=1 Tax=Parascaris univalens TaxID=6257 RepID=A0A915AB08_PARUN
MNIRMSASLIIGVVLMGRRSCNVSFAPNAYVFPGGKVELNDETLPMRLTNLPAGRAPVDFARRIAAVRELFEECGLLAVVNCHNQRCLLSATSDRIVREWHSAISEGHRSLFDMMSANSDNLLLDVRSLKPFSNWLTPFDYAKRFDTYFYVTYVDRCDEIRVFSKEFEEVKWVRPSEILIEAYNGNSILAPPQAYELTRIVHHGLDDLHRLHTDTKICPQLVDAGSEVIALLNGDYAYKYGKNSTNTPIRAISDTERNFREGDRIHRITFAKKPLWSNIKIYSLQ